MDWKTFKQEVLSICDIEETKRVLEEFALFEQRNWQNYVLFCVKLLKNLNEIISGSVKDSYVIRKYLKKDKDTSWLNHKKSKDILFNDAFRLNVEIVWTRQVINSKILKVLMQEEVLACKEKITNINSEILVLSDNEISDEEFEIILNEKKESTIEEIKVLQSVLIINITARVGIWYEIIINLNKIYKKLLIFLKIMLLNIYLNRN